MTWPPTPGPAVDVDIDFSAASTAPIGSAVVVDLAFGAAAPGPGPDQPITVLGRFALSGTVSANLDAGTHRGIAQQTALPFTGAAPLAGQTAAPWDQPTGAGLIAPQPWRPAEPLPRLTELVWADSEHARSRTAIAWGQAPTSHQRTAALWAQAAVQRMLRSLAWEAAQAANGARTAAVWQQASYTRHRAELPWQQAAALLELRRAPWDTARRADRALGAPWGVAGALQTCRSGPAYVRPATPGPVNPGPVVALRFCALAYTGGPFAVPIVFGVDPCAGIVPAAALYILPARYYMAVHSLTAALLPGLESVPIFDLSLSSDVGSFGWTFSASGPASLFDQLAPSAGLPTQIRITLDGLDFVFVVDTISREEKFGQRGARIAGRSATALLARPYARETTRGNTTARTAQQLAADALEFTGAALDWGLEDWLVPAGAWSHSGTPLSAVQAIVEAAGGYLQSHRSAATLLARHPYPTLPGGIPGGPWNWGGAFAADVELAPDALITQSIERRDGPDINAVYVSGTSQGVVALVKRTGTAGDKLAPMLTDPLITATEAARQRGLSVLGAGGPKHLVSMSLPLLTGAGQPGVLDVGQLVQVNASPPWRGRVRSVSVSAKLPTARQTVALERHLETV